MGVLSWTQDSGIDGQSPASSACFQPDGETQKAPAKEQGAGRRDLFLAAAVPDEVWQPVQHQLQPPAVAGRSSSWDSFAPSQPEITAAAGSPLPTLWQHLLGGVEALLSAGWKGVPRVGWKDGGVIPTLETQRSPLQMLPWCSLLMGERGDGYSPAVVGRRGG